jgi:hypothetical protein
LTFRLPFGKELDAMFAIFVQTKLEQLMLAKREGTPPIEESILVAADGISSLSAEAVRVEPKRMYSLWDAVSPFQKFTYDSLFRQSRRPMRAGRSLRIIRTSKRK